MQEVTFRVEPGGPYGAPTGNTDTVVELWCNEHCDLLDLRGEGADEVLAAIEADVGIRDRLVYADRTLAITEACLRERAADCGRTRDPEAAVEQHLSRHGCLLVPPLRYAHGAKFFRVLALDPADLTGLYRDLTAEYTVAVESKRSIDTPVVESPAPLLDAALPSLSPRQRETLSIAYERGYYEQPRRTTTAEIADELGVTRRTAEEHLRRAENRVIDALIDHVGRP